MHRPIIGITMGEPAGIGPEIACKALTYKEVYKMCRPFIYGDIKVLKDIFRRSRGIKCKTRFKFKVYDNLKSIRFRFGEIAVVDFDNVDVKKLVFSRNSAMGGRACGEYIKRSIDDAMAKKIDAVVTSPISKPSFRLGGWGVKYAGHTEMFADLTRTKRYAMLLACGNFKVIHVTTHLPLKDIFKHINKERVKDTINLAISACRLFGIKRPRVAVCGLNPHAGEGGKMGLEEIKCIIPAIKSFSSDSAYVTGPVPADTMWSKVYAGAYDIGIAMYHDQGHIPAKLLGFAYNKDGTYKSIRGVNITLGIPIIRVSVDHGTAYGKAGKGIATPDSLLEAIRIASLLAKKKR